MNNFNLENIENELKKRHAYPYNWFRKQNDIWDGYTQFIYDISDWETLVRKIDFAAETRHLQREQLFQYAANRWYNFWSAKAVEHIFAETRGVETVAQTKDSEKDFYLFGTPFDHKTSVFPKQFNKTFQYAQSHKPELIKWLYENQSAQKRHHFKNRLFIVVYDKNGEHWKLKAEISMFRNAIREYLATYRPGQLHSFYFSKSEVTLSDLIWISK